MVKSRGSLSEAHGWVPVVSGEQKSEELIEQSISKKVDEVLKQFEALPDRVNISLDGNIVLVIGAGISVVAGIIQKDIDEIVQRIINLGYEQIDLVGTLNKILENQDTLFHFYDGTAKTGFLEFVAELKNKIVGEDPIHVSIDDKNRDFFFEVLRKNHEYSQKDKSGLYHFMKHFCQLVQNKIETADSIAPTFSHLLVCSLIEKLGGAKVPIIITTNWDCFLEEAVRRKNMQDRIRFAWKRNHLSRDGCVTTCYKVHGSVPHPVLPDKDELPDEFVFYSPITCYLATAQRKKELLETVAQAMKQYKEICILTVGYSMNEEDKQLPELLMSLNALDNTYLSINPSILQAPFKARGHCILPLTAGFGLMLILGYILVKTRSEGLSKATKIIREVTNSPSFLAELRNFREVVDRHIQEAYEIEQTRTILKQVILLNFFRNLVDELERFPLCQQ